MIMGANLDEIYCFICIALTIMTKDNLVIPSSPANQAIEVNDEENKSVHFFRYAPSRLELCAF